MDTFRQYINEELKNIYSEQEIRGFYFLVMEFLTGQSRVHILANKNNHLSETQINDFEIIVSRLKKQEPLQYILGEEVFCGLRFNVNSDVLIPRPETEELVLWITEEYKDRAGLSVLDIGTGSGCIALSLAKKMADADVRAYDVSAQALDVARENGKLNGVEISFEQIDVLSADFLAIEGLNLDIIVSNPPYVCEREKAQMEQNVLGYEPPVALFVPDNDPLVFYRRIALFAQKNLSGNGALFFEINQAYGKEMIAMLTELGFAEVTLRQDIFGNDRMIKAI
ncbi:MAG: peptide chain release factor N(5)-glutamine methyltransferase [Paludibacteraceae bacterium]|nr:peptide chain release factor N(5)-glutamine methyltransferase [Paludibacteraceae bacterium]